MHVRSYVCMKYTKVQFIATEATIRKTSRPSLETLKSDNIVTLQMKIPTSSTYKMIKYVLEKMNENLLPQIFSPGYGPKYGILVIKAYCLSKPAVILLSPYPGTDRIFAKK